jgi:prevent-host-death family protein
MNVAIIGIRELRDGLSRHLASVREGTEITITDHGKPIAKIVPIGKESGLERLLREGIATLPAGSRRKTYPSPVAADGTVSDLIKEQRR